MPNKEVSLEPETLVLLRVKQDIKISQKLMSEKKLHNSLFSDFTAYRAWSFQNTSSTVELSGVSMNMNQTIFQF